MLVLVLVWTPPPRPRWLAVPLGVLLPLVLGALVVAVFAYL